MSAAEAVYTVPPGELDFRTTEDVAVAADWIGQERALAALELGLRVPHAGYNIYICGLGGTHREQTLAKLLAELTKAMPRPGDRVLVQNFQNRDRPRAFYLPAGQGNQLRRDMQELVEDLKRLLPETFRKETFEEEKEAPLGTLRARGRNHRARTPGARDREGLRASSSTRRAASFLFRSRMAGPWSRRSSRSSATRRRPTSASASANCRAR